MRTPLPTPPTEKRRDMQSPPSPYTGRVSSASGQLLQSGQVTVESISVTAVGIAIRILPDSLIRPLAGNGANGRAVPSQDQRASRVERPAVARARVPPIRRAVDQRIPRCLGLVLVHE